MIKEINLSATIQEPLVNARLDVALKELFKEYSRATLTSWIKQGAVQINGVVQSLPKFKHLKLGDSIIIRVKLEDHSLAKGEAIALNVVYEDLDVIVINKPVGLVVHPGAGVANGTLMNGLLYRFPELSKLPRAGLVHRIDKDTSGLLLIARNLKSYNYLTKALQRREINREYLALVRGNVLTGGVIDQPIMRDTQQRVRMKVASKQATTSAKVRQAVTYYWIAKKFKHHTLLRLKLATGRTHQIRVHLAFLGYPIVGDQVYSRFKGKEDSFSDLNANAQAVLRSFKHQALHAASLTFKHPATLEPVSFSASPPLDFQRLIDALI